MPRTSARIAASIALDPVTEPGEAEDADDDRLIRIWEVYRARGFIPTDLSTEEELAVLHELGLPLLFPDSSTFLDGVLVLMIFPSTVSSQHHTVVNNVISIKPGAVGDATEMEEDLLRIQSTLGLANCRRVLTKYIHTLGGRAFTITQFNDLRDSYPRGTFCVRLPHTTLQIPHRFEVPTYSLVTFAQYVAQSPAPAPLPPVERPGYPQTPNAQTAFSPAGSTSSRSHTTSSTSTPTSPEPTTISQPFGPAPYIAVYASSMYQNPRGDQEEMDFELAKAMRNVYGAELSPEESMNSLFDSIDWKAMNKSYFNA